MNIDSLIIEVTRRCNMECGHCLRGDAQNMDIQLKHVKSIAQKLSHVGTITFTGGEPSLASGKILEILEIFKKNDVSVGNFYIATNGKAVGDDFFLACAYWYAFCDDNEITSVSLSNDMHHEDLKASPILSAFTFFHKRDWKGDNVIAEGHAEDWGERPRPDPDQYEVETEWHPEGEIREGDVYLNCKGNIVAGCDFSYATQDDPKYIVCHVTKFSLNAVKEFVGQ